MAGRTAVVDRDGAVLVLVDIQERLAAAMERREEVVGAAGRLARAAHVLGIPLIVTRQNPSRLGDTVPELARVIELVSAEGHPPRTVDKTAFCCGAEWGFLEALAETGRDGQVVLAGMETHICVTQTALALVAGGREVFVVADSSCSRRGEDHSVALDRLRHAGVVVTTSECVMYEALGDAGAPEFKALLSIVKGG